MKTPKNMLEDIHTELIENTSLLETIFRHSEANPETENAMACLIRSMHQTQCKAQEYIDSICNSTREPSVQVTAEVNK